MQRLMYPRTNPRRRASSLVRALVVASATLAILLVCFSMYQFSQTDAPRRSGPRLPDAPTQLAEQSTEPGAEGANGIALQQAVIGPAQNITITIYPRKGTRAALEITVSDWVPKPGSDNEFILRDPDVRLRTRDGNDVRVVAREGVLEARRKSGGGLDPQRGRLVGGVVIEYDRRTEKDKADLSPEQRNIISPHDLVRVECEELEFDLEYDKLIVHGRLTLRARDVFFEAHDLQLRFNGAQSRVESMRIRRGGRIELLGQEDGMPLPLATRQADGPQRVTLVEWIRASVLAQLEAQAAGKREDAMPQNEAAGADPGLTFTEDGVPVFRSDADEEENDQPPVQYLARFEGNVDAAQYVGDKITSRLTADVLEILRDFRDLQEDRPRSTSDSGALAGERAGASAAPREKIVLKWSGRLAVDAVSAGEEQSEETTRSRITATGSPVRLSHPEVDIVCRKLVFDPDSGKVELFGDEASPAVVRSTDQGSLTGVALSLVQLGDQFSISGVGPGTMTGDVVGVVGFQNALGPSQSGGGSADPSRISFDGQFQATGRIVRRTRPDFTGFITTTESRILDSATFLGGVRLESDDTALEADTLTLTMGVQRTWRAVRQVLKRVQGRGAVVMTQGDDRLSCDAIDIAMVTTADGRALPTVATATGKVVAVQGERTLRAADKLIVDFIHVPQRPASVVTTSSGSDEPEPKSTNDFVPVADVAANSQPLRLTAVAARMRAFGEVTVFDPSQPLDLSADRIDCTVSRGGEIETALITGLEEKPASVRLDSFSVAGAEIRLDVANQRAEIPGRGRMTLYSKKDLDGRKADRPIPIVVTWDDWMKYHGRENRAVFSGHVHAASETTTTFDCDELRVEFDDVVSEAPAPPRESPWGFFKPFIRSFSPSSARDRSGFASKAFSKEIASLFADGHAVAYTARVDPATGGLKSRARISGSKLSVNLRANASKMLIEGPGQLQLEDFQAPDPSPAANRQRGDLFGSVGDSGPSKTLIEWKGRMWYDFSIDQIRFEDGVNLKHFSGAELQRIFGGAEEAGDAPPGRRTFLNCDVLTVDFLERNAQVRRPSTQRMGRLSTERLQRFRATGNVILQDKVERLWISADDLTYERDRMILAIVGTKRHKARIVKREEGKLPTQISVERLFYNLKTGQPELRGADIKGG